MLVVPVVKLYRLLYMLPDPYAVPGAAHLAVPDTAVCDTIPPAAAPSTFAKAKTERGVGLVHAEQNRQQLQQFVTGSSQWILD